MRNDEAGVRPTRLGNGDTVAVIGGGPAGALFAHFLLAEAQIRNLNLTVVLFEGRLKDLPDKPSCNQSAGVVARDFVVELGTCGIDFPSEIIERRITGYLIGTARYSIRLHPPRTHEDIFTVLRGRAVTAEGGPERLSLDNHLLRRVQAEGVSVIPQFVESVRTDRDGQTLKVTWLENGEEHSLSAQLVAIAVGANSRFVHDLHLPGLTYTPPRTTSSIQAELPIDPKAIDSSFGNAIAVSVARGQGIEFTAVTPKADHVTVTIIGEQADEEHLASFLGGPIARRLFGRAVSMSELACRCYPRAIVGAAKEPFGDRVVIVGDAAASRLFKNGLQSSLITARAAARASVRHGVSAAHFARHYSPVCRAIERDNRWGHLLFQLYRATMMGDGVLTSRIMGAIDREQQQSLPHGSRPVSELLWDILCGTRPYGEIVRHLLRPRLYANLASAVTPRLQ